jgi:hypothetical protein
MSVGVRLTLSVLASVAGLAAWLVVLLLLRAVL